jgi:hypothetical protein
MVEECVYAYMAMVYVYMSKLQGGGGLLVTLFTIR